MTMFNVNRLIQVRVTAHFHENLSAREMHVSDKFGQFILGRNFSRITTIFLNLVYRTNAATYRLANSFLCSNSLVSKCVHVAKTKYVIIIELCTKVLSRGIFIFLVSFSLHIESQLR